MNATASIQAGERTHQIKATITEQGNGLPPILDFKCETDTKDPHFKLTINRILNLNPCMRSTVAEMIRDAEYDVHVGGHHVAIMNGKVRLGLFTGNSPDFR